MTAAERDHYQRLGLERDAATGEVVKAYRRAARLTHPDSGGSDEDFAAVAEAYRVLGDPDLRVAYDRELDGVGADWDDVGWGADVGPVAPDEPAGGAQVDVEGFDLPPQGADPGDAPGGTSTGPHGVGALHPFLGPPRRIPDPLASPRATTVVPPGMRETAASIVCWILVVMTFVLQGRATAELTAQGRQTGSLGWEMTYPLLIGGMAILLHAAVAKGSAGEVSAWVLTGIGVMSTSRFLTSVVETPSGLLLGAAASIVGTLAAGVTWALLFRQRRADPELQRRLRETDPQWLLDRYHRAVEWNRVRTALQQPGTSAVILGERVVCPPGYDDGLTRRWTFEPRTGHEVARVVPDDAPQGSWLVLDDEGDVIAAAPAGAPEAWVSALTPA